MESSHSIVYYKIMLQFLLFGILGTSAHGKITTAEYCRYPMDGNHQFGYVVSIRRLGSRQHVCTGVLVQPSVVITAAHCVDARSPYSAGRKPIIHVGGTNVDDVAPDIEVFTVEETFMHPKWDNKQRSPFNVAVLTLNGKSKQPTPQVFNDEINLQTGMRMAVLGWGSGGDVINVGDEVFGDLKYESQEFITGPHCNTSVFWNGSLPNDIFCGLNDWRKSSCLVDSGAPLILLDIPKYQAQEGKPSLDYVVGINIDGASCGEPNKPDIYLDIRVVKSWLEDKTKKKQ